jgi:DNA topoisomerase III
MTQFNRLYIAEKQSVADGLAAYLARTTGKRLLKQGLFVEVGDDRIVAMSGHLLEQAEPEQYDARYKTWTLTDLPIMPSEFKLVIKPNAKNKVDAIRKLLGECTTVVGYGDPDGEGQLLQDELLIYLRNRKPVLRLWANALDDATLGKALAGLKPNTEFVGWYEAALARSQADWLYGMNMSRACSLHAYAAGARFKFAIGRVQTPTLGLVVRREHEIRNFKATSFFVPYVSLASSPAFRATWFAPKQKDGTYADPRVDLEGSSCSARCRLGAPRMRRSWPS